MSQDEINRDIRDLTESGDLSAKVAKQAIQYPIEGEKIIRLDRIEKQNEKQSQALFGDKQLGTRGLIGDVHALGNKLFDLEKIIYRGIWTIGGGMALGGFLIMCFEVYIEWIKK